MNITVPWNAAWSSEMRYEIRPCRWVQGNLAIWQPHTPGEGKPIFAKPHNVRQRRSIAEMRCTVCGEKTPENDRWWFKLGRFQEGWFMTTEAPVHHACAEFALTVCPHLKGREADLEPMPGNSYVLKAIVGGPAVETDFAVRPHPNQKVVGSLKIAWNARYMESHLARSA